MSEKSAKPWSFDKVLGLAIVGVFVIASLAIDAYTAFHLGENAYATAILVAAVLAGGVLKCYAPVKARDAFYSNHWGRGVVMVVVLAFVWAQSVGYELTFYAKNFGDQAAERSADKSTSTDLAKEKTQIEARLANKVTHRNAAQIEALIDAELAKVVEFKRTLAVASKSCTDKRAYEFRHCGKVLEYRGELASAQQIAADEKRLKEIRDGGGWVTRVGEAHPGAALIARIANAAGLNIDDKRALDVLVMIGLVVMQLCCTLLAFAWFPYTRPTEPAKAGTEQLDGNSKADAEAGEEASTNVVPFVPAPQGAVLKADSVPEHMQLAAFCQQYVEFGHTFSQEVRDFHRLYVAENRSTMSPKAFMAVIKLMYADQKVESKKSANSYTTVFGMRLNAAGQAKLNVIRVTEGLQKVTPRRKEVEDGKLAAA